jgi:uncharacterized protein (DUF362 family)
MSTKSKIFTRREFLEYGAATGAVLASTGGLPTFAAVPTARVAAVRGDNLASMAHEALEAVGGIETFVDAGETVFIKPNFVSAGSTGTAVFSNGDCAKPDIVITVAEECLRAGASKVIVGEGGHRKGFSWDEAVTVDGSTNLAAEAVRMNSRYKGELSLAWLEEDSPAWDEVPSRTQLGTVAVSSLLARADKVISIPVLKTHAWTHVTFSLKNFIGTMSGERYGWPIRTGIHTVPEGVEQVFIDVVAATKPVLAIVDCSICIEGDGPTVRPNRGRTVDMKERLGSWFVLASPDLVAADATAARIIGHDPAKLKQIAKAHEQGLGEIGEDSIELVGEKLDDLRVEWDHARIFTSLEEARAASGGSTTERTETEERER